jgi:thiamine-phosphate pyrophosphorylase
MLRCAITDRSYTIGKAAQWAADGVDFVQLRDKALAAGALAGIARTILTELCGAPTKLLINSRCDVALATRAHGVQLTASAEELTPVQVRELFRHAALPAPIVGISCHTLDEVTRARDNAADLILFGPVFEKRVRGERLAPGTGLGLLREACAAAADIPVLALGGVTAANAEDCAAAGARGIAAIRLFM